MTAMLGAGRTLFDERLRRSPGGVPASLRWVQPDGGVTGAAGTVVTLELLALDKVGRAIFAPDLSALPVNVTVGGKAAVAQPLAWGDDALRLGVMDETAEDVDVEISLG